MRSVFLSHPLLRVDHWVESLSPRHLPLSAWKRCDENRYCSTKPPLPVKRPCNFVARWLSDLSTEDPTTLTHPVPTSIYSFRRTIPTIHLPDPTVILHTHPNCPLTHALYVPHPLCWPRKDITRSAWLTIVGPPTTTFNIKHGQRRKGHNTTL